MADNLIILSCATTLEIPVARVADAMKERCTRVLVLGEDHDGQPYYAATYADNREMLWQLEQFKAKLLAGELG